MSADREATAELRTAGDGRVARLESAVSRIRTRTTEMSADRAQLIVGGVLVVLGLLVILLGWVGASRTPFLFEQIPYLISGGLFGLALAFLGGFVYFAYWVARLVQQSRVQSERAEEALHRIEELLSQSGLPAAAAASARTDHPARGKSSGGSSNGQFVATKTGTMFHRPDCPVVAERSGLRRVSAQASDLEPCRLCEPLADA